MPKRLSVFRLCLLASSLALGLCCGAMTAHADNAAAASASDEDPFLWLEAVEDEGALDWVRERNAVSLGELQSAPGYTELEARLRAIYDSKDRIPGITKIGDKFYNFWQDAEHPQGIWRRTSLESYRSENPEWEVVLDLDALNAAEGENWVWKGAAILEPTEDLAIVSISRGGADATEKREFDLTTKTFVEGGFVLPEAKSYVDWIDRDTVWVGSDFGRGTLTESGYPRQIKKWRRGTPLAEAELAFEIDPEELGLFASHVVTRGHHYDLLTRAMSFYTNKAYLWRHGEWVEVAKPDDVTIGLFADWITFQPREDWTLGGKTYLAGSLLTAKLDAFMAGGTELQVVFEPSARTSLDAFSATQNYLLLSVLDNVRSRPYAAHHGDAGWTLTPLDAPEFGKVSLRGIDAEASDAYFMTVEDFLTPTTLYHAVVGEPGKTLLKTMPAFFDATGLTIEQREAVSADGTRVPYFQIGPEDLKLEGTNPTLLYGYGGFEVSMDPFYSGSVGAAWLEKGGVYVLANIRGGGEFGPRWHRAALKENRQRAFDDFAAVAEDLIARGVTSRAHLGTQGGSNGGLLMGVMLTQRPDLFSAVLCQVPLLDMKRYHLLLAGASWMGEYGDPDIPEQWAYISQYSPYQNVKDGVDYPRTFFVTSTRDDRVHPGHARKMMALMESHGHDVLYYENIEGGHGGAANNEQRARMNALGFQFLWNEVK